MPASVSCPEQRVNSCADAVALSAIRGLCPPVVHSHIDGRRLAQIHFRPRTQTRTLDDGIVHAVADIVCVYGGIAHDSRESFFRVIFKRFRA